MINPAFSRAPKSGEMRSFYLDLNVAYAHSHRIILTTGLRCSNPRIRDTFVFSEMRICPSVLSLIILNYTKHKQWKTFLCNKSSYFGQLLTFDWHYPALEELGGGWLTNLFRCTIGTEMLAQFINLISEKITVTNQLVFFNFDSAFQVRRDLNPWPPVY